MSSFTDSCKKFLKDLAKILAALLLFVGMSLAYGTYANNKSERQATEACEKAVALHEKSAILAYFAAAKQTHKNTYHFIKETDTAFIYFQGFAFSRHICSIQFNNGVLQKSHVEFQG